MRNLKFWFVLCSSYTVWAGVVITPSITDSAILTEAPRCASVMKLLGIAAKTGDLELVRFFVQNDPDLAPDSVALGTSIPWMISQGVDVKILEFLLEGRRNKYLVDATGRTPMYAASEANRLDAILLLEILGVSSDQTDLGPYDFNSLVQALVRCGVAEDNARRMLIHPTDQWAGKFYGVGRWLTERQAVESVIQAAVGKYEKDLVRFLIERKKIRLADYFTAHDVWLARTRRQSAFARFMVENGVPEDSLTAARYVDE